MARRRLWFPVIAAAAALTVAGVVGTVPARAATTTTVTVGSGSGTSLHDDFIGLSFEASILASPALTSGNLAQYMKTLGPGVMRFGCNFVDTTFWTAKGEKAPSWAVTVSWPSMAIARATSARMESSSSAIRTRGISLVPTFRSSYTHCSTHLSRTSESHGH